jgi:hypothetical protein
MSKELFTHIENESLSKFADDFKAELTQRANIAYENSKLDVAASFFQPSEEIEESKFGIDHRDEGMAGRIHFTKKGQPKVGEHIDFYHPANGDKKYGKVTHYDGKKVHINYGGETHKFNVHLMEDVEQIEELSKKTIGSYASKAVDSLDTHSFKSAESEAGPISASHDRKASNRNVGLKKAIKRLTKEEIELSDEQIAFFDNLSETQFEYLVDNFDQLDEISKRVLGNYVQKARANVNKMGRVASKAEDRGGSKMGIMDKLVKKIGKRQAGINTAQRKMSENVDMDGDGECDYNEEEPNYDVDIEPSTEYDEDAALDQLEDMIWDDDDLSDEIDEEVDLEEGSNSISSAAKKAEASRQRALRKAISAVKNGQHPDSAIRDHDLFKSDAAELHKHYKENVEVDGEPIDEISTTLARNYLNHNIRDSGERALNKSQHDHYDKAAFGDSDKSKANERSIEEP